MKNAPAAPAITTTVKADSIDGKQVGYIKDGKFYRTEVEGSQPAFVAATSTTTSTKVTETTEARCCFRT